MGCHRSSLARIRRSVILLAVALLAVFLVACRGSREAQKAGPIDGYQDDVSMLTREYSRFHGKPLRDPELEQQFQMAGDLVAQRNHPAAIEILEKVAKRAAVPVVFNNLAALYAAMDDRTRAINAYREALARDAEYRPVRDTIERLNHFSLNEASPVRKEIEPNNNEAEANVIGFNRPAEGEITVGDTDSYKFVLPEPPRDIVQIEVENLDKGLELGVRIQDAERKKDSERVLLRAGESFKHYLSDQPNTAVYLQVFGARETVGHYRVTIHPMKAFDALEPNEDIFTARRVELGQTYEANIMDADDTDYYAFESPDDGIVAIDIKNDSPTLIPALTTFDSDRRNTGFGPDVRKPGENLAHRMEVQAHRTYYLQVWSQVHSAGRYTLTIRH
jgi:tetratricopeptide (TPR) repeat protein